MINHKTNAVAFSFERASDDDGGVDGATLELFTFLERARLQAIVLMVQKTNNRNEYTAQDSYRQ